MNTIKDFTDHLESIAPLSYQESYDNSGLLTGNPSGIVTGIMVSLDCTEEVVADAIENKCNMIVAHHPIIFSGLKKLTGRNYIERTIIKAIKNDIAIYALHTNLDNVSNGVNAMIAKKLGLINTTVLSPKQGLLKKLVTFCLKEDAEKIRSALFNAGGGNISNYDECCFNIEGKGTFRGNENSNPYIGKKGVRSLEDEIRIELIFEGFRQHELLKALMNAHPYEEVAYDIYTLENTYSAGAGIIGELPENQEEMSFLRMVKLKLNTECIRHTKLLGSQVKKVAICGGSGSFLLDDAIRKGAQALVTADFKYHQFFDADGKILIADTGHYESEQFTMELIKSLILEKFSTFAVRLTEVNTNPVHYM